MYLRCLLVALWVGAFVVSDNVSAMSRKARLGKLLFFDTNLSTPPGQACASCHAPKAFFTDPDKHEPTSEGVIKGLFGKRNAPTLMYSQGSPPFHFDKASGLFSGGQFLDGRASSLVDQAKGPFLQALEMNNANEGEVVDKVRASTYAGMFKQIYGPSSLDQPASAYQKIAESIAAFEKTPAFAPMTSKYDYYLMGMVRLTPEESRGKSVYEDAHKGNCAACHPNRPSDDGRQRPVFTDFSYDNLGIPKNPSNRYYQQNRAFNREGYRFVDEGLAENVNNAAESGKFKVPTLRNIDKTGPYMHNGYFNTLRGVIEFYNTRDVKPECPSDWTDEDAALAQGCWPAPELNSHVNRNELGHLGLSPQNIDDLIAFLKTLTDGYRLNRGR